MLKVVERSRGRKGRGMERLRRLIVEVWIGFKICGRS